MHLKAICISQSRVTRYCTIIALNDSLSSVRVVKCTFQIVNVVFNWRPENN